MVKVHVGLIRWSQHRFGGGDDEFDKRQRENYLLRTKKKRKRHSTHTGLFENGALLKFL